jgi:RNA-directed DNA polymerase
MLARDVAIGLALAALDGAWDARSISARIAHALGTEETPSTRGLGRELVRVLAIPSELEAVAAAILRARSFRALSKKHALTIRAWHTPEPRLPELRYGVPLLTTVADVAALLDVSIAELDWLADTRGMNQRASDPRLQHYVCRWIEKRSGGARLIEAPKRSLRDAQRRVLDRVIACIPPHEAARGFVRGRSVVEHASAHAGRTIVARLDLASFFWTIAPSRIRGIFEHAGYSRAVSAVLTGLATTKTPFHALRAMPRSVEDRATTRRLLSNRHLPQGAPTSGALANLACFALDRRLAGLASRFGATYTRYADDLAFSGDSNFARDIDRFLPRACAVVIDEGFSIQHRKTRVMRASRRQELCSIVVNAGTTMKRADLERLEAILVNCARHGPEGQNRSGHPDFRAHLAGRVAWVGQLAPKKAERLREVFRQIRWPDA